MKIKDMPYEELVEELITEILVNDRAPKEETELLKRLEQGEKAIKAMEKIFVTLTRNEYCPNYSEERTSKLKCIQELWNEYIGKEEI